MSDAAAVVPTESIDRLRDAVAKLRERIPLTRAEGDVHWSAVASFVEEDISAIEAALASIPGALIGSLGDDHVSTLDGHARMRLIEQLGEGTSFTAGYTSSRHLPVRFMRLRGNAQVIGSDGNRIRLNWLALDTIRDIAPPSPDAAARALGDKAEGVVLGGLPEPDHDDMGCYTPAGCICGRQWRKAWATELAHDDDHEYTVVGDCRGGSVEYRSRTPKLVKHAEQPAGAWAPSTQEAHDAAVARTWPERAEEGPA